MNLIKILKSCINSFYFKLGDQSAPAEEFTSQPNIYPKRSYYRPQKDIDAILDKIAKRGYGSISSRDRKILDHASKKI